MGKRWLWLVFLLLLPLSVQAISLSPAQQEINFQPNLEENHIIKVGNPGKRESKIILGFEGELAQYIEFKESAVILPPNGAHQFTFTLKFPENIAKPGRQLVKIHATEEPFGISEGILPRTSVTALLWINVPYTGKYAELTVTTKNVNTGEPVPFTILMENLGIEAITNAITTLNIYNIHEILVETLTTTPSAIKGLSSQEKLLHFPTEDQEPGDYKVIAVLDYDGKLSKAQELEFLIGTLYVDIRNYTKYFKTDTVNQFDIEVTSRWNSPVQHLHGEIQIHQKGKPISGLLKTPSVALQPWETKTLTTFWDTQGLEPGDYTATITLHYQDKTTTKTVEVTIAKTFELNTTIILTTIIILILLIDFTIWLVHKRRTDEED